MVVEVFSNLRDSEILLFCEVGSPVRAAAFALPLPCASHRGSAVPRERDAPERPGLGSPWVRTKKQREGLPRRVRGARRIPLRKERGSRRGKAAFLIYSSITVASILPRLSSLPAAGAVDALGALHRIYVRRRGKIRSQAVKHPNWRPDPTCEPPVRGVPSRTGAGGERRPSSCRKRRREGGGWDGERGPLQRGFHFWRWGWSSFLRCPGRGGWELQLIINRGHSQGRNVFVQVEQKSHFWQML